MYSPHSNIPEDFNQSLKNKNIVTLLLSEIIYIPNTQFHIMLEDKGYDNEDIFFIRLSFHNIEFNTTFSLLLKPETYPTLSLVFPNLNQVVNYGFINKEENDDIKLTFLDKPQVHSLSQVYSPN